MDRFTPTKWTRHWSIFSFQEAGLPFPETGILTDRYSRTRPWPVPISFKRNSSIWILPNTEVLYLIFDHYYCLQGSSGSIPCWFPCLVNFYRDICEFSRMLGHLYKLFVFIYYFSFMEWFKIVFVFGEDFKIINYL